MKGGLFKNLIGKVAVVWGGTVFPVLAWAQFDPNRGLAASGLSNAPFYLVLVSIMQYLLLIFTVIAVIGFIVSGLIFITAGASGRAELGQKWLVYTIIGIIVGLAGYIFIRLITGLLSGAATY